MRGRCFNCGDDREIEEGPPKVTRHALELLAFPVEVEMPRLCATCGRQVGFHTRFVATGLTPTGPPRTSIEPAVEQQHGRIGELVEPSRHRSFARASGCPATKLCTRFKRAY